MADGLASTRDLLFISYSHADEPPWLGHLRIILKPYVRQGKLQEWSDPYIRVGDTWRREIGRALARARIGVCLISPNFLASDFIDQEELPPLLAAAAAGEVTIVAIPVSAVDPSITHFAELQWARDPKRPLDKLKKADRNAALVEIVRKIADAAGTAQEKAPWPQGTLLAAGGGTIALRGAIRLRIAFSKIRFGDEPAAGALPQAELATLHGVPEQRPNFVARDADLERVRDRLLAEGGGSVGITGSRPGAGAMAVGLHGMGGIGKTELAVALAHDDDVRAAFPDGIFWLPLGQTPDLLPLQATLWRMAGGSKPDFADVGAGQRALLELLKDKAALIVLDDIWRVGDAAPLAVAGKHGRLLTTTRDASLLTALGATEVSLDVLGEGQALQLLVNWSGADREALPDAAKDVAKECGYLPLALALAGAQVKDGLGWADVLAALRQGDLEFLDHPYGSVFNSLRASIDALPPDDAARYGELAVAVEDVPLPAPVIARLWRKTAGLAEHESRKLLQTFANKALLSLAGDGDAAAVSFHDLQYDFLRLNADDPRAPHRALLDAYRDEIGAAAVEIPAAWARLPTDDPYLWPRLADHLLAAGREDELRALLLDYRWMVAKLVAADVNALLADYDRLPGDEDLRLVQQALRLSAHVLAKDAAQLPSQLTGRLRGMERSALADLIDHIKREAPRLSLVPQTRALTPPGGALIRTFEGHTGGVNAVAVLADGHRVLSGSGDKTLKLWDVETGALLRTLAGRTAGVDAVAVLADGQRALSASYDQTLKLWDLETGVIIRTLEGHTGRVIAVSVLADGHRALSGSGDQTLKLWDLETGALIRTLAGHSDRITAVSVLADGRRALSGSWDGRLKLWDLETGAIIRTLRGHTGGVNAVAVLADGQRALSGSYDQTLKLWDLETGTVIRTLRGHTGGVNAVAVLADGRRALSGGSWDEPLRLWDLETGAVIRILEDHTRAVRAVAVLADGARALSASFDPTLKLWDLETGAVIRILHGHTRVVRAVLVLADGHRALSGSLDTTLRLWDLETGAVIRTLEGHTGGVGAVAELADGRRVLSGSEDKTLKLWDLETGVCFATFTGDAPILCVAAANDHLFIAGDASGALHMLRLID